MTKFQLIRTAAASLALIGSMGLAQAQTSPTISQTQQPSSGTDARVKPAANTTAAPNTVQQTQQPMSSGDMKMKPSPKTTEVPTAVSQTQQPMSGGDAKMKPSPKTTEVSPTITQTQKPGSGNMAGTMSNSTAMASTDKPMKPKKEKKMKSNGTKPTSTGVGSGSAGTTEGRVEGTTNSNSKGEPAKRP